MKDPAARQKAIQAIVNSEKAFLTPADIAPILDADPHAIRIAARQRPELLKFEFILIGNRTKIPRIPFLRYLGIYKDQQPPSWATPEQHTPFQNDPMTNEELLLAITQELSTFRQEIMERLDKIESQTKSLSNTIEAARHFINTLTGLNADKQD